MNTCIVSSCARVREEAIILRTAAPEVVLRPGSSTCGEASRLAAYRPLRTGSEVANRHQGRADSPCLHRPGARRHPGALAAGAELPFRPPGCLRRSTAKQLPTCCE